jgi:hypothetical protein
MEIELYQYVNTTQVLRDLQRSVTEMSQILALELSGERDGHGTWQGADVLHYAVTDLERRIHCLADLYRRASDCKPSSDEIPY